MTKHERTKGQTTFYKHTHTTTDRVAWTPLKTETELRCFGRVSSYCCPTSDTCCVNLVTNPVISHDWGKNREMLTTSGTYPRSFLTQTLHNGQPGHGGYRKTFEVTNDMNAWFSSFLVSRTLYQRHPNRNHKLWYIVSTERYILQNVLLFQA